MPEAESSVTCFWLVVEERRGSVQRVQVVLEEALLREPRARLRRHRHGLAASAIELLPDPLHVAGYELEPRVLVGDAAVVRERDPAGEISVRIVLVDHEHVVAFQFSWRARYETSRS